MNYKSIFFGLFFIACTAFSSQVFAQGAGGGDLGPTNVLLTVSVQNGEVIGQGETVSEPVVLTNGPGLMQAGLVAAGDLVNVQLIAENAGGGKKGKSKYGSITLK